MRDSKRGVTLIEAVFALVIIIIIVAIVMPQFQKIKENQVLKTATVDILSSIDKARSQTLSSVDSSEYGVHFQGDRVVIFKGTVYSSAGADNETITLVPPATISDITLAGGGSDMYFSRLSGAPSKTGTITVTTSNFTKVITIGATGFGSAN